MAQHLCLDGGSVLTSHVLNARRSFGRAGIAIHKEFPASRRKIAAVLAYGARADAVALGLNRERRPRRGYAF